MKSFKSTVRRQDKVNAIMTVITKDCSQPKHSLDWFNFKEQLVSNYIYEPLTEDMKQNYGVNMRLKTDVILASDAFFPFSDSIEVCNDMGVSHILQPGGSIMDNKVIETCDNYDIYMALSGIRVFTH